MASRFWVGGTGTWDASDTTHWSATSNGAGGASVPGAADTVTFDAASGGGAITLGYSPTIISITMGAFTGTFDASTFSPTMTTFSNSGTGTRTLTIGSGQWSITGNNTTVWSEATITNLTLNKGTNPINFTYSGATGNRTITHGASADLASSPDINITAGTDTIVISNARFGHVNFTGFSGLLNNDARIIFGNLTLSSTMTFMAGASPTTFQATTGTQVLTSNNRFLDFPIGINCIGGTFQLGDELSVGSSRTISHFAGTFDLNNKTVSMGRYAGGASTRSLLMGSGDFYLIGTGTVWSTGTIGTLTFTKGTGTIFIADNSPSTKTFAGAGLTFNNLSIPYGSVGAVTITGSNTFSSFSIFPSATTIIFTSGTTTTVTNWSVNGRSNNSNDRAVLQGTAGTWTLSHAPGTTVFSDFVTLTNCTGIGGGRFFAVQSSDGGGNSGWVFTNRNPAINQASASSRVPVH